jgi:tRNA (guanine37-N1)-methyltransferase
LISGDHAKIEQWQKAQSLQRTAERRQDLLD